MSSEVVMAISDELVDIELLGDKEEVDIIICFPSQGTLRCEQITAETWQTFVRDVVCSKRECALTKLLTATAVFDYLGITPGRLMHLLKEQLSADQYTSVCTQSV